MHPGNTLSNPPSEVHHSVPPQLEDTKKSNKKRNECPFCQIVCAKPSVLDKHIRTHTNERPYPCEPCGFAFKTKSNLYKHKKSRTHNLKVEKGIDSHSEEIVAELGEGIFEERDQISIPSQPSSHPNFPHVLFTQSQTINTQSIVMNNSLTNSIPNNSRIPTMPPDSRLPLILSSNNPQSPTLNPASRHQVPRFLTTSVEHLRPEQNFSSDSNSYTARPGHLSSQTGVQGGVPRFLRQSEPHSYSRGTIPTQHIPVDSNQYPAPRTTHQSITHQDMALASHHRAIAVASLTQVSSSSSSLGSQRNSQLPTRPPVIIDQGIGQHIQREQRPLLSSPELQSSHRPPVLVAGRVREQQQHATDLSKAIRSSAAAAVAAVTHRPYPLPQAIPTPLGLVKDLQHPARQYTNSSKSIHIQDQPSHILQSTASSPPPMTTLPSGFTVSQVPNPKHQRYPVHNTVALSSPPTLRLPSSPSFSLTTVTKQPSTLCNDNEPRDLSSHPPESGKPLTFTNPNSISNRMPLIQLPQQPLPNKLAPPTGVNQPIHQPRADVHVIDAQRVTRPMLPTAPLPIAVTNIPGSTGSSMLPSSSMPTDLSTKGINHHPNSPKKSGTELRIPELQQRIDKVISENQAIVETLDPLWPRRYMRQSSKDKEKDSSTSVVKYATPVSTGIQIPHSQQQCIPNNPATVILNSVSSSVPSSNALMTNSKPLQFPQQPLPAVQVGPTTIITNKGDNHHQTTIAPTKLPLTTISGAPMLPRLPDSVIKSMRQQEIASPKDLPLNLVSVPSDVNIGRTRTFSLPAAITSIAAMPHQNAAASTDSPLKEMKTVREVWVNSQKKPSKSISGNVAQLEDLASSIVTAGAPFHPQNPEKSMIKALLLEAGQRSAGQIPAIVGSSLTVTPSDIPSNTGSSGGLVNLTSSKQTDNQIVIEVKNTTDGGMPSTASLPKPTFGNVSLIVNPIGPQNLISTTTQSLIPVPKTKLLSPLMHSDIHGSSDNTKQISCPLCHNKFHGIDLVFHQQNHCPKGPNSLIRKQENAQIGATTQAVVVADTNSEIRIQRIRRHSEDTVNSQSSDTLPSKHPKLDSQAESSKAMFGRGGGGIIAMGSKDSHHKSDSKREGLLQIAQPGLFAGGGVLTSKDKENDNTTRSSFEKQFSGLKNIVSEEPFNIPGIPTPHMSGILTGIKPNTSLFSLPGKPKAFEITSGEEKSTNESSNSTSLVIEPIKAEDESKNNVPETNERHVVPFVPGIPGPYSQSSTMLNSSISDKRSTMESKDNPTSKVALQTTSSSNLCEIKVEVPEEDATFLRPSSLPLTPGSFKQKKHVMLSQSTPGGPGATLVSPETPRPRKCYAWQYQNGTAYTYLGLKRSTRVYFCTLSRPQPFYVIDKPKLSMYSNWKVVSKDSHPSGLPPTEWLGCYNSTSRSLDYGIFTAAMTKRANAATGDMKQDDMIMTHSSQWKKGAKLVSKSEDDGRKFKDALSPNRRGSSQARSPRPQLSSPRSTMSSSGSENESTSAPDSIRRVEGGYKSSEDVKTYVRGRGRGRYVCDSCGIRCKKPSMLKKHAKTHSDMRPYTCRYCNFAFKTKGNLTKHMKSKAHHKKCVEIGISPIPMSVEDLESRQESGEGHSVTQVNI